MNIKRIATQYYIDFKTILLIILLSTVLITYIQIEQFKAEYENDSSLSNNESWPLVFIGGSPRSGINVNKYFI